MAEVESPASAYLQALLHNYGFMFVLINGKYSCSTYNRGKTIHTEQHVGDVQLPRPSNATEKVAFGT